MDRATPSTGNEEIELYMRIYYSLLRSSGEVEVRSLEETHSNMNASLHRGADSLDLDLSALVYCAARLRVCMSQIRLILLGQSPEVFNRGGYPDVEQWTVSKAAARRRKMFFDGEETLAVFINSISDIDELVPMLTTYQIEWNKIHNQLAQASLKPEALHTPADYQSALGLSDEDFAKLQQAWGDQLLTNLRQVAQGEKRLALRLLSGSLTDYRRATEGWWGSVLTQSPVRNLRQRPVYFVSSNMHALPNLFSNYAALIKDEVISFLNEADPEGLAETCRRMQQGQIQSALENLLYYVMRKYLPFVPASFDRLLSTYVLDLLPYRDIPSLLANFRRVLKPGDAWFWSP